MARSIGKVKIRKVKEITQQWILNNNWPWGPFVLPQPSDSSVEETVFGYIDEDWFEIWEGAWTEIYNIVSDTLRNHGTN